MIKNRLIVGLTGNIGSGKSAVADMLRDLGAGIIDTDDAAREVTDPGTPGLAAVVNRFGDWILDSNGALDRRKVREIVFSVPKSRRDLEAILHPLIMNRVRERTLEIADNRPMVVWVVPLLFEAGMEVLVDEAWLVTASEETRLKRIMARDDMGSELALSMIRSQMPEEQKIKRAKVLIDNNGTMEQTREQVIALWSKYSGQVAAE